VRKPRGAVIDRTIITQITVRRVRWKSTFRLVPARYPPINFFERIADPADWEALYELEALTNPRLRQQIGQISIIPKARRVSGPGASVIMAPFTHVSPLRPTRFSAGQFGVYYAARLFETALREVAFHMGRFYASTNDPPHQESYQTYKGSFDRPMHDLRIGDHKMFLDPDPANYAPAQELARQLRETESNGIVYPSVRHRAGECIAVFWPDLVPRPIQTKKITLKWDGAAISQWYDHETEKWVSF
jgi:hypothetical protein